LRRGGGWKDKNRLHLDEKKRVEVRGRSRNVDISGTKKKRLGRGGRGKVKLVVHEKK